MRIAMSLFIAAAIGVAAPEAIRAAQFPGGQDPAASGEGLTGPVTGADCHGVQQPPWHGSVRGPACQTGPQCRGSNVYQANPWEQLQWRQAGPCVRLPACLPRFDALMREGYLLSPTPPALPRCRHCGAAIEGGF